jgi:hypothetical protein
MVKCIVKGVEEVEDGGKFSFKICSKFFDGVKIWITRREEK